MVALRSRRWRRRWGIAAVAGATLLAGCGFHPVYAVRDGSSPARREMGQIDVALMPDRAGQLLRQALQQRLSNSSDALAKRYELSVSFGISSDTVGTQQDSTITRVRQTGSANWTLKLMDPAGTVVTTGAARALDGLNIIDNQYFASDLAGEATQRRLADAVATQITLQLATYFSRRASAS